MDDLQKLIGIRSFLQDAVVSYLILRGIRYADMCCSCGGKKGIIIDGTQVAFKSLASLLQQNFRVPVANKAPSCVAEADSLDYLAGVFSVNNKQLNKAQRVKVNQLLNRFVLVSRRRDVKKNKLIVNRTAGLDLTELNELRAAVKGSGHKRLSSLLPLLELDAQVRTSWVGKGKDRRKKSTYYPHQQARPVLTAIVSGYPVQGIIPPRIIPNLRSILSELTSSVSTGSNPTDAGLLPPHHVSSPNSVPEPLIPLSLSNPMPSILTNSTPRGNDLDANSNLSRLREVSPDVFNLIMFIKDKPYQNSIAKLLEEMCVVSLSLSITAAAPIKSEFVHPASFGTRTSTPNKNVC